MELKILDERIAKIEYAKEGDVGIDLRACRLIESGHVLGKGVQQIKLSPGATVKIGTGVAFHQENTWACVVARSGLGCRKIRPANAFGVVDTSYQGEIIVCLENAGEEAIIIQPLDRIAQLVFMSSVRPEFSVVDQFSSTTSRSDSGFGSTGVA